MLSKLREFFRERGSWTEPYGEYLFLAKVKFTTYHTTFFMKDYEINSFLYLIGTKELKRPKEEFEKFREITKELLELPPDHYFSSFCLLSLKGEVPLLYSSKSIWFGIKGKVEWGTLSFKGGKAKAPPQMARIEKFLNLITTTSKGELP